MSGLADAPNTGGVVAGIEARFARADEERRRELDRLIKAGARLNTEPRMPLMQDEKGEQMARREPKKCCGSRGPRCLAGCTAGEKKTAEKADAARPTPARLKRIVAAANKARRGSLAAKADLDEMSVADLLELRAQVQEELEAREEQLASQLAAIRGKRAEAA